MLPHELRFSTLRSAAAALEVLMLKNTWIFILQADVTGQRTSCS
jgi:hypothetical protein